MFLFIYLTSLVLLLIASRGLLKHRNAEFEAKILSEDSKAQFKKATGKEPTLENMKGTLAASMFILAFVPVINTIILIAAVVFKR